MKQEILKELEALRKKVEALPEENKFEVGKWYRSKDPNKKTLFVLTKYTALKDTFDITDGFGFDFEGNWKGVGFCLSGTGFDKFIPATHSEIESALIAEAKKRGFKEGAEWKSLYGSDNTNANNYGKFEGEIKFVYDSREDVLSLGYGSVYKQGKWSKIIKDEQIKIGGYAVVKYEGKCGYPDGTEIDGNFFSWEFWEAAKLISEHSKAKIMVGCSKQFDVSLETINQILKMKNNGNK